MGSGREFQALVFGFGVVAALHRNPESICSPLCQHIPGMRNWYSPVTNGVFLRQDVDERSDHAGISRIIRTAE